MPQRTTETIELLYRLDERQKVTHEAIQALTNQLTAQLNELEGRVSKVEVWQNRVAGMAAVIGSIMGMIASKLLDLFHR